ncbi:MAG: hypothetical protein D6784_15010 [Chloroflexi bacterium]|nr:MAG: hypothetical protein D6784_15010 [Chloroflexota bacterium]
MKRLTRLLPVCGTRQKAGERQQGQGIKALLSARPVVMLRVTQSRFLDYLFILTIIMAVLSALLFKIGDVPPAYPWSDESEIAADAVATLKYGPRLFYPGQLAGGSLAVWLEAGWMALFGRSLVGLRLLNGLVNLATAVLIYQLALQLPLNLGSTINQRLTALTAALLFAVSTWLLGLGRIAAPNWSLVGMMSVLAFYLFWQYLNHSSQRRLIASGVVLGLLFYGYLPGYFVPLVLVLFLVGTYFTRNGRLSWKPSLLLPVGIASLVAAPLLLFFILHPTAVLQRPLQLVNTNEVSSVTSLLEASIDMLSTFGLIPGYLWQGITDHLVFDPLVTVLFVVGVLTSLWHWRSPGHLFLLIWWGVMIIPAVASRSASQGFIFEVWRRGVGAQPVSFILIAVGLQTSAQFALTRRLWPKRGRTERPDLFSFVYPLAIALTVGVSAWFSYKFYFEQWATSEAVSTLFAKSPVQLVQWMESHDDSQTAFIFPVRPNVSPTTRPELFTVRYLYNGPAFILYPVMDEQTAGDVLVSLLETGPQTVKLMMPKRITVDPKGYFEYLLGLYGRIVEQEDLFGYRVISYEIDVDNPTPPRLDNTDASFGAILRLTGQSVPETPPVAGQTFSVALRWQLLTNAEGDYNASLILSDSQGVEITRADEPLLSTKDYLTTRFWLPGSDSFQYFSLPIPADIPPGHYRLLLTAYNAQTGERLPPPGTRPNLLMSLAEIEVRPTLADPAKLQIPQPLDITFPEGLVLKGTNSVPVLSPGDILPLSFWWHATAKISKNIGLLLALVQPNSEPVPLYRQPKPLVAGYLTPVWPSGSIYRANYRPRLPVTLTGGSYMLALRLVDIESSQTLAENLLFPILVEARPHQFEAPLLANSVDVDFGHIIRLRGFEIDQSNMDAERSLNIKVQWKALRQLSTSYKVFLHLIDEAGRIVAQVDTLPQQGKAPTTGWLPGEIIDDTLKLPIPSDLPGGNYRLVIGLYSESTGQRLPVGEHDQLTLIEINR